MGDRTYTSIQLAGVINEEYVDELLDAINADGLTCDDGPEISCDGALMREHLQYQLYACEANYGTLQNTEEACKGIGVSYLKMWDEGGGYAAGMEIYNALTAVTFTCGKLDGEPAVTLSDLEKAGSPEALIGYLKAFANFEENYGPLEIVPLDGESEVA